MATVLSSAAGWSKEIAIDGAYVVETDLRAVVHDQRKPRLQNDLHARTSDEAIAGRPQQHEEKQRFHTSHHPPRIALVLT